MAGGSSEARAVPAPSIHVPVPTEHVLPGATTQPPSTRTSIPGHGELFP